MVYNGKIYERGLFGGTPISGNTHIHIYIYINIPGVSTTLRFWGHLQNTSFLSTFDTFWGRFMQKRPFIFQAGAGYIHYALLS